MTWTPTLARIAGLMASVFGCLQLVSVWICVRAASLRPQGFWASPDLAAATGICLLLAAVFFFYAWRGLFAPFPRSADASPLPVAYAWFIFFGWLTGIVSRAPSAGKALPGICGAIAFLGAILIYFAVRRIVRRSFPRG